MKNTDLKVCLTTLGWTQRDLAHKFQCDADTVNRWCTGRTPIPGYVVEYMRVVLLLKQAME
jgi:DNA-binding transcriptional regulator YiaG